MSTRSTIGILNSNDTVTRIYCHFDGYLEGVGQTLKDHFNTEEKVRELLSMGDASSICGTIKECCFYKRDRKEENTDAKICPIYNWIIDGTDFYYLFHPETNEWKYQDCCEQSELVLF